MITVRLFATFRDRAGQSEIAIEPGPNTVSELLASVSRRYPVLSGMISKDGFLVSVNKEFAKQDSPVQDGDEVALMPPFSGGSACHYSEGPQNEGI